MDFPDLGGNDLICLCMHFTKINSLLKVTSFCQFIVYSHEKDIKLKLIEFLTQDKYEISCMTQLFCKK